MITKKRKIDFTDNSIQELMQETYHEIVDERNKALTAYKKITKDMNDHNEIAMIGKIANDLLKIVDNSIDKKIQLLKLQASVLYKTSKAADASDIGGNAPTGKLSEDDKKMVQEWVTKNKSVESEVIEKNYR